MTMTNIPFVESGTYLFRFLDPFASHFWNVIDDTLSNNLLFLNSRTKFNDPFDSSPIIQNDLSNSAIRDYFNQAIESPYHPNRSFAKIMKITELKATGRTHLKKKAVEIVKASLNTAANKLLDEAGLLSFSQTAENPLLWGHYAASYTGVCVIFRRSASTNSSLSVCSRVSYVSERPRLPLSLLHELAMRSIAHESSEEIAKKAFFLSFLHKSDHWAYEKEARIFHPRHAFKKLPFDPKELVGFILGPKSSQELEKKIRNEIRDRRSSLSLDRAVLSQTEFKVIIPHKYTREHASAA
jgi:Protein of unknown function (DUF2971)